MSDEDDDDAGDDKAPTRTTSKVEVSPQAVKAVEKWLARGGGAETAKAFAAAVTDDGDDDDAGAVGLVAAAADADGEAAESAATAETPPASEASETPAPDDATGELAERLARAAGGESRPSRRDELRSRLESMGIPEGIAKTLAAHAKSREVEAWIQAGLAVSSQTDTARQPSAPSAPAPVAAPQGAPQELGLREALAGVRTALSNAGVFEKGDIESLAGPLELLGERLDRIERSQAESQEATQRATHESARARYQAEIGAAREGLSGQFPQVLDAAVYRDRIAPIFEALATGETTKQRSLKENLAAACRAALSETTDADRRGRTLQTEEAARRKPAAPRTGPASAQTISREAFAAGLVKGRLSGQIEDPREYGERWKGRVK